MNYPSISKKLFRGTKGQARENIKKTCQTRWLCVVNFLYFAQAMKFKIYEREGEYKTALLKSDILCIDGIAMQIFDWVWQFFFWWKREWTENLNGTDFLPYILEQTREQKVGIIMYTVYDPLINKGPERMDKWLQKLQKIYPHIDIIFAHQTIFQKRGDDFPFDECIDSIKKAQGKYDHVLLLNGIGGPIQEIRTEQYKNKFEHTDIIIMNNWATLDYYSGFEKRAPRRVVKMRIGETIRRTIVQPKKNFEKFLTMFRIVLYRWYIIRQYIIKVKNNIKPLEK